MAPAYTVDTAANSPTVVLSILLLSLLLDPGQGSPEAPPPLLTGWNATSLFTVRALVANGSLPATLQPAMASLLHNADNLLHLPRGVHNCPDIGPWSVMDKPPGQVAPSGNRHDFFGLSTYAWPCTAQCPSTFHDCSSWWRRPA